MNCDNWQEFFTRYGEYVVSLRFYEMKENCTVEELFQHFAARARFDDHAKDGRSVMD